MVLKEKVLQLAEEGNDNKVYFITLGAVDRDGKPYDVPSLYDLLTAEELAETGVVPLHVQDLAKYYTDHRDSNDKDVEFLDVYDLVDFFIKRNEDSHIIIDEFPIFQVTEGKSY